MPSELKVIPVIMCGGAGTRLWPVSRNSMPKQFIPLMGGESTFQRIANIIHNSSLFDDPIVITNVEYRFTVLDQLQALNIKAQIVLEPMRRDSAPAVAVATELALQRDPEAVVAVLAADHLIQNEYLFIETCTSAAVVAMDKRIVTIGIPPSYPSSGYGYISSGETIAGYKNARVIKKFVEKPNVDDAIRYVVDGYLWNSGNFIFHAGTMRAEIENFKPEIMSAAIMAVTLAEHDLCFTLLDKAWFASMEKKSIDYAIMELTEKAAVVPGTFGWSDVGGWSAVQDLTDKQDHGNAITGRGYVLDGSNNYVHSTEIFTAIVGIDDLIVVSTQDAVLVLHKDKSDDVKKLVETLEKRGVSEAIEHREVYRPWGKYISIDRGLKHQVKRITVKPGGILSLQKHLHRAEHWVVVAGTAQVTRDNDHFVIKENEAIYLPMGCVHRLENKGKTPLELIEVQVGSYLGEDDIVRFEDIYKRK